MGTIAAIAGTLLALAAIPLSEHASSAQEAAETDIIAVRSDDNQRMTVPVRIGESGALRFLIDTGAQNTVLSSALASRLALPAGRRARLVGVAGSLDVDTVNIEELILGRRSYYRLLAPLLDGANIGADGILGLDSLQDQRVLLDFKHNLMAVDDAKTLGGNKDFDIVVTARRRSGQLIVTDAVFDGVRVAVVIDTGAQTSIGNLALQRFQHNHRHQDDGMIYSVTGQAIQAQYYVGRELQLGRLTLANMLVAYADAPAFAALGLANKPAILLGMRDLRAFDRVAIDFKARTVLFDLPQNTRLPGPGF